MGIINNAFNELCLTANRNNYEFLLEADLCGWLFHKIINELDENNQLHLDTRVNHSNEKYDIVIGNINYPDDGRPYIIPSFVAEVKIFPKFGFTQQQHNVHFHHIINDDLQKLNNVNSAALKIMAIMDGKNFLEGRCDNINRLEYLKNKRDKITPKIKIYLLKQEENIWQYKIF